MVADEPMEKYASFRHFPASGDESQRCQLIIVPDKSDMTRAAMQKLIPLLEDRAISCWIFAAGNTQADLYKEIRERYSSHFKNRHAIGLDEYIRSSSDEKGENLRSFNDTNLFNHIYMPGKNIHWPPSEIIGDPKFAISRYRDELNTYGPANIAILGLGANGHIGFNEPGSEAHSTRESRVRIVPLTEETRKRNGVTFKKAITMGIADILESERIILMASGRDKAEALAKAFDPKFPQSSDCPASFLRDHRNLIVIADEDAASKLPRESEFRNLFTLRD